MLLNWNMKLPKRVSRLSRPAWTRVPPRSTNSRTPAPRPANALSPCRMSLSNSSAVNWESCALLETWKSGRWARRKLQIGQRVHLSLAASVEELPFRVALRDQDSDGLQPRLQLPPQSLHHLPNRLLIAPVPSPLSPLGRFHQPGLRQDGHMVRNRRL